MASPRRATKVGGMTRAVSASLGMRQSSGGRARCLAGVENLLRPITDGLLGRASNAVWTPLYGLPVCGDVPDRRKEKSVRASVPPRAEKSGEGGNHGRKRLVALYRLPGKGMLCHPRTGQMRTSSGDRGDSSR